MIPKVAVYSIARNEAKHAERWATSCADADYRIVLDTGSTDDTIEALRAQGVTVAFGYFGPNEPGLPLLDDTGQWRRHLGEAFRFDAARNAALDLVPADADICVSLDLDEVLAEGAIDAIRAAWTPGITKLRPWINTGTWWRCDRIHARSGYRWVFPCHEVTEWVGDGVHLVEIQRDVEAQIWHRPDDAKPRDSYLPLLELAVKENPQDTRMWFYLCRQYHYAGDHRGVLAAADVLLRIGSGWVAETAAACRLAGIACEALDDDVRALDWLTRGVVIAPHEAESWAALAKFHHDRQNWPELHEAAYQGALAPTATHYMTDQAARAWGLWDFAALGAQNSGDHDVAVSCGYKAWRANPDDGRLSSNLHFYVAAQAIPTYAVIPKKAGERDGMTSALKAALLAQGVVSWIDETDDPIYAKWNSGIKQAGRWAGGTRPEEARDRWNVIVLNNDVVVDAGFVDRLVAALRSDEAVELAYVDDGSQAFTGWCFALRGESLYRVDEQYEWWYGDTDLWRRVVSEGGEAIAVPLPCAHLHPNESTVTSPERLEMARRDEARYAAKWNVDPSSLFLAQNPGWGLVSSR